MADELYEYGVLIIEPDPTLRQQLAEQLQCGGWSGRRLHGAADLQQGWELLRQQSIDVVLINPQQSDSSGLHTIQQFRLVDEKTPLVVLDPEGTASQELTLLAAGAQECIARQYTTEQTLNDSVLRAIQRGVAWRNNLRQEYLQNKVLSQRQQLLVEQRDCWRERVRRTLEQAQGLQHTLEQARRQEATENETHQRELTQLIKQLQNTVQERDSLRQELQQQKSVWVIQQQELEQQLGRQQQELTRQVAQVAQLEQDRRVVRQQLELEQERSALLLQEMGEMARQQSELVVLLEEWRGQVQKLCPSGLTTIIQQCREHRQDFARFVSESPEGRSLPLLLSGLLQQWHRQHQALTATLDQASLFSGVTKRSPG
ncbi:MAG: hypothetical protein HJJLKODD_01454 [Phycisphaerae bacterium]|nr:hypothetical protein [Phycisphaerae bacterium]